MTLSKAVLLLSFLCSATVWASPETCSKIEQEFGTGDLAALIAVDTSESAEYWQAFHAYRVAAFAIQKEMPDLARQHLKTGVRTIEKLRKSDPENVELVVLSAMMHGQKFILGRGFGWIAGLKGYRLMRRAEKLSPDNPRLLLMQGVGQLLAPGILKSKPEQAKVTLKRGLDGFGDQSCDQQVWGQVDLLLWLGRAHSTVGETDKALEYYQQAFEVSANNVWVQAAVEGDGYVWQADEKTLKRLSDL